MEIKREGSTHKIETFYRAKTGTRVCEPDLGTFLLCNPGLDLTMKEFNKKKEKLMDIEKAMHFSYDLESTLTDEERVADEILKKLSAELKTDTYNTVIHDYFQNFVTFI